MTRLLISALALAVISLPAADRKKDPNEIGNRKVSGTTNFYSIESELALGRQLAMEVQKQPGSWMTPSSPNTSTGWAKISRATPM